ncbi:hypothetical protein K458DRAFT_490655 [Lentithecium fluviatile CBS 122367]|uniref:Uncharacterized protein n=1 Tax=Lentithecium fluviatile CBS 122367 TaxID=1168545 RepID=A0A6G1IMX8_9PLEO|nr:hypothetical protein K458DRAFT_490655 [Lentithecium fluviatile CBS 122367]
MSDLVYYGVWINWSRGKSDGSTITLTPSGAGFMVAFLAIFVSVAGGSLWRILAFLIHQQRITKTPRDGLYYQQQAILRNTATPGVASWQLLWLVPPWRKLSRRPFWRSFPLILVALLNLSLFFAAGILVAEVTRTPGSEVLVRSPNCGNWTLNSTEIILGFQSKTLNDTVTAANYARACYGGTSNALECNQYTVQSLPYTKSENVTCPFADGMCLRKYPAMALDTGNLSSHHHLGINAQTKDRVTYRKMTTCAPLMSAGFTTSMNYTDAVNASIGDFYGMDGDVLDFYNYGPRSYKSDPRSNFTLTYNRRSAFMGTGYELQAVDYTSGNHTENTWHPDRAVLRDDGDVSLMFISANNILYYGKVEDPIFAATSEIKTVPDNGKNVTLYTSDYFVNPPGCVDQHQFCNPANQRCTKLDSYDSAVRSAQTDLELNPMQYGTVSTLSLNLYLSIISQSIGGRGSVALRAQEVTSQLFSAQLPKDQWKTEVEYWFSTGLAKVQKSFVEYASGPSNVLENTYISKPYDAPSRQLCDSQKIKTPPGSGAASFSTLGVAIILAVGGLLILCHTILEYIVANVIPTRNYKLMRWAIDDKLQLQRLAFEGAGMGTWHAGLGSVPTTTSQQLFGMEASGKKEHSNIFTLYNEEKALGTVRMDSVDSAMTPVSPKPSDKDWYPRPMERNDSYQLPPIHTQEEDREIWPLVDTVGGATQRHNDQSAPSRHTGA